MQKFILEIGVLNGAMAKLKNLDRSVMELKEQLRENRKATIPSGYEIKISRARLSRERDTQLMEDEPINKNPMDYQQGISRNSKLDIPRFSGRECEILVIYNLAVFQV